VSSALAGLGAGFICFASQAPLSSHLSERSRFDTFRLVEYAIEGSRGQLFDRSAYPCLVADAAACLFLQCGHPFRQAVSLSRLLPRLA
jgi:hypothetical protein